MFSRTVQQLNLLQPTFVMSVGDLIEGYSLKEDIVKGQWDEFDGYVKKFEGAVTLRPRQSRSHQQVAGRDLGRAITANAITTSSTRTLCS